MRRNFVDNKRRFRIRHSSFGYFQGRKEFKGNVGSNNMIDVFEDNPETAPTFTLADLRIPMNATGQGLFSILVSGYTGLRLEDVND